MATVTSDRMAERERIWTAKPALRHVYNHLFARMRAACVSGAILEVGGGTGSFKAFVPETVSTDVVASPRLDVIADAQRLPFAGGTFANIAMCDVLHHVEFPRKFLAEAARILPPGGRLIMAEPAITPLSWPFYRFFHEEPVDMGADPLVNGEAAADRDPFSSNQAIPTLLVGKYRDQLTDAFPDLRLMRCEWLSLLAYPLSGGFKSWCAIPKSLVAPALWVEDLLTPFVGRLAGFRMVIVFERLG